MYKYLKKPFLPAMLGASIEYYDIALYGYMAPILTQIFLPHLPKTTGYFFYFLFEFFAVLAQVVGARYFGKMGDKEGRKKPMYFTILGTSIATFAVCLVPTYQSIGIFATYLFVILRMLQSFFLGGEYNGGAIYCLEHENNPKLYGTISGIYCACTVIGIVIASLVATIINVLGIEYFKLAYLFSFLLALLTYKIRKSVTETPQYLNLQSKPIVTQIIKAKTLMTIIMVSLFFGVLYGLPTRIFNVILPIAIGINPSFLMAINTLFLILYMVLLVIFGKVSDRYGIKKIMLFSIKTTIILTYPTMVLVNSGKLYALLCAKTIFTVLTAAFIAPFHAWAQDIFVVNKRYQNISTYYTIGKCLSTILLALSIKIYDHFENLTSISFILIFSAIITLKVFYEKQTT